MPTFFPEGSASKPTDNELRSLAKYCQLLFDTRGPGPNVGFPEGNSPKPQDDEGRLWKKINALRG